jgi:ADP-ribosyl-[dinitrogen reductase] hydrolase
MESGGPASGPRVWVNMEEFERYRGAMLGLAVGDALGAPVEFRPAGAFEPLTDMRSGGPFKLETGQWTDDTSMALCLAASLVETNSFDPQDQMERYLRWLRDGYMSSTGRCFDIGHTVRAALARYEASRNPYSGPTDRDSAGNGSLMRLAPVVLAYASDPEQAISMAGMSSRTTHGAAEAVDGCRFLAALILGALEGRAKDEILADGFTPVRDAWQASALSGRIAEVAAGSYKARRAEEIEAGGYVVETLEAALWAFYHAEDFRHGALLAVNLGDDADTTGAVYGQLAGAYFGRKGIPVHWRGQVAMRDKLMELADGLYAMAFGAPPTPGSQDLP